MSDLKMVYLKPTELKPYVGNARQHSPTDIEAIKASIRKFGFSDPIGIWGDDNVIVEGHGRQIAAIEMGLEEVPCIRLDHMTDDQRKAYALAHNKTAELSSWDFLQLEEELAALEIQGFDMSEFGFDETAQPELDSFFSAAPETQSSSHDSADEQSHEGQVQCPHCGEWFTP